MKRLNGQTGISLVEIMVALVISLFLLAGIVQVYTGNRATFSFTNALAEIQENGRFALDTISQDLRLAGEWGCIPFDSSDTSNINNTLNGATVAGYSTALHDFVGEEAIEGTNNDGSNGFSDSLTIRGGKPGQANVESPFTPPATGEITIDGNSRIGGNDFVLIMRCGVNDLLIDEEADIMRVTASTYDTANDQTKLTLAGNKSQRYENDASVIELQTVTYSIEPSAIGTNEPTLIRSEFGNAQELVEGIEDMQIRYGVDDDGDRFPNQYLDADNVPDFEDVVAVRIMLLVRSLDDFVTEDPQTYTFNGVQTTAADRRIRQVFTATIALRNRIGSS